MVLNTLLFFDISTGEIFIVLMVLFLIFGPHRMPEIARKIGKAINQMKRATSELSREFNEESDEIKNTFDKEAKEIRSSYYNQKKKFDKENKNLENELSIKTDIKRRRKATGKQAGNDQTDEKEHNIDTEKDRNQKDE
jgi:sec-independent protein translocase protein TatB